MVPVVARLEAWLPFTYSRSVAPSYVSARGDQLVFADGTPARFWGTNVSAYSLFQTGLSDTVTSVAWPASASSMALSTTS